eukprot:8505716-Prorocentrum_lima.AAC.1
MAQLNVIATEVQSNITTMGSSSNESSAQAHTTTVGPQHAGKAPPPVLGETSSGKAAPCYFN